MFFKNPLYFAGKLKLLTARTLHLYKNWIALSESITKTKF